MTARSQIKETPWDARALGIDTYEITTLTDEVMAEVQKLPGHFTVRVDPLSSKKILHNNGFYYSDTLIEPFCSHGRFIAHDHPATGVTCSVGETELAAMAHGGFQHGRFHRDFQVKRELADLRYDLWLKQLFAAGDVLGLTYEGELAGFFGLEQSKIALLAVGGRFRDRGLAKFLWSAGCADLFRAGHAEITSSISASNVAALNVFAALGFSFRNPLDIYHRLNG